MPPWITSGQDCLEWLLENYSQDTARQTLMQLKAATHWAVRNGELRRDPFGAIDNLPVMRSNPNQYASFTVQEREIILSRLDDFPPRLARWGKFLFMVGARPCELRALQKRHIAKDWSILQIHQSFPMGAKAPQATKNKMVTDWPINLQQRGLLSDAIQGESDSDGWIFKNDRNGPFDYNRFQRDWWGPLMVELAEEGAIAFPLSQYHCRHTWITEALKILPLKDVEYLARVKAKVLLSVYAQKSRAIVTPEI